MADAFAGQAAAQHKHDEGTVGTHNFRCARARFIQKTLVAVLTQVQEHELKNKPVSHAWSANANASRAAIAGDPPSASSDASVFLRWVYRRNMSMH